MYESSVLEMKAAFGQALVATFREVLFVFLQTLQNAAITRPYVLADPLHVFGADKLIPFSFLPARQPLPDDLLTWRIQLLQALCDAASTVYSREGIWAVLLDFGLTLHLCYLSGSAVARDWHATEGRHSGCFTGPCRTLGWVTGYSRNREIEFKYALRFSDR